ncbi:uncharacterized protein LODBEIA_P01920 [Lodderomyces beijingensis]|uniref:D-isomer specific 2-hydroxyacid dehydrogenase NAD-binding domain-containing protein n=1 Tax=Lodderomyces beijingensis TaxID=1775926 RepID=A0ABP0ZCR4_9ASCO
MTIKQKVLFLELPKKQYMRQFESKFECIQYNISTLEQCILDFQTKFHDVEAIYCGWAGFAPIGGFKGKLLTYAPRNLKIVTTCTIGIDHFDVDGVRARGIVLSNVPSEIASEAVADLVLYNAIASFRNLKIYESNFGGRYYSHTTTWRASLSRAQFDQSHGRAVVAPVHGNWFTESCCGRDNVSPRDRHAVIVGFGNIGRMIGKRLACIGMKVHYVKRSKLLDSEEAKLGYKVEYHASLEQTASFADLVVIACPGTPSTQHMINEKLIDKMEQPFRIINIGRGSIVDEDALVQGLERGKVLFAGLDVFEQEPLVHPGLHNRQDVVLTPHIGSSVVENDRHTAITCLTNIEHVMCSYENRRQ